MAAAHLDSALAKVLLSGAAGVNVDRAAVEQAVNQQLIHGGTLDTLLLEGGVVDEPTVARALASAWNTAPVPVRAFDDPDARAVALLPARMAVAMGLLPFSLDDDGTLHVACRAPLDAGLVSEVGTLLRARVVAHVVPEIRLLQGLAAAYDHDLEERFVALLRQLAPASKAARRDSGDVDNDASDVSLKSLDEPLVTWDLAEAMAHLAAQDSRDGIARVAVAFARRFLPFAAVFGVRDNAAVGWHRSGPAEGVQFTSRPFPVPSAGFLAAALSSPSPLLLKPDTSEGNAATLGWLGRRRPKTVLVVPIVVARRPVGVLYADGGIRQKDPRDVGELVAFAARLGPAFESLLRQRHRAHPSLFPQPAATIPPTTLPPTSSSVLPALSLPSLPPITLPPAALPTALPSTLTPPTLSSMPTVQASLQASLQAPPPMPAALPTTSTQPLTPVGLLPSGLSPLSGLPAPPPMPSSPSSSMPGVSMGMPLPGPPPLPRTTTIPGLPAPPPMPSVPTPSMGSMSMGMAASMPSLPTPPPLPPAWSTPPTSAPPMPASLMPSSLMPSSLMPAAALEPPRDGSSPFARGYISPPATPPPLPPPPALPTTSTPPPGDVLSSIVLTGIGAPLNEHLAKSVPPGVVAAPLPSTLFRVADDAAPAAWRGALSDTVEKGLQGGSRAADGEPDDDLNWEAVVYDPAHAAELDAPPPAKAKQGLDFPGLSTSTLADLYGDNGDANSSDDDDTSATSTDKATPRDPPLAAMSHKDLVELLFAGDDALVARAARELASRGLAAVPALGERFPGRLKVDPFDPGVNVRTAAALGPLVDVLGRLGNDGLDAAITHVDSRYPAHRFAAVLLFALTPDARAMDLLRNRLHDAEPRIQKLAAEALVPFLAHPRFESLLVHLRERAAATTRPYPAEARRRATELLGEFRDVGAVPLLLTLLGFTDMQETARTALRAITLQDFGSRAKAWEKWWTRAKKRSRLDWLLEGLSSEEFELRSQAHRELADLAGDDFGYRADGDKRARQRAVEVWQQWWLDEQRRAPPRAAHLS